MDGVYPKYPTPLKNFPFNVFQQDSVRKDGVKADVKISTVFMLEIQSLSISGIPNLTGIIGRILDISMSIELME